MLSIICSRQLRRLPSIALCGAANLSRMQRCTSIQENAESSEDNKNGEPLVISEKIDSLTLIGLNRPEKRNALNKELISNLNQAITTYENDPNSRVAVLYGTGGNFCSGLDLEDLSVSEQFETPLIPLIDTPSTKPIIASVSGYAVAEGLSLALACDLQIIEETAVVGLFNRRFGVPLSENTIARLVSYIGFPRAMDIILTGRPVRAKEAVSIGLATEMNPCGAARGRAISLARSLVKFPKASLLTDRAVMYAAYGPSENIRQIAKQQVEIYRVQALKEIPANAAKFKDGIGRHGSSKNLTTFNSNKDWIPS